MTAPTLRDNADMRALERRPLAECMAARTTYEAIQASAAAHGDAPALIALGPGVIDGDERRISYRDFLAEVHRTANMLRALGLRTGEVVSFLLPLRPEAYALIFGGAAAGIVNSVNHYLEPWQIAQILRAAGTRILVAQGAVDGDDEIWAKVEAVRDELPDLKLTLRLDGPAEPERGILDYHAELAKHSGERLEGGREIAPTDTAAYFHTGGTTGTPKLVQHTHHMQASQIWSTGAALGLGPDDVLLVGLPLFHIGGSVVGGVVPLSLGTTLVIASSKGARDPAMARDYWRLVHKYRVTVAASVPTVLGALLNVPIGNADISSIRYGLTGGAAFPVEVGRAFAERIRRPVIEGYGMTETTSYTTLVPRDGPMRLGSVGVPLPHVEVKTIQVDGEGNYLRDCETDEIGLVVMRGDCIMPGYVQEPYNRGAFIDGWLNSGDLGRFDADGYLWLTGRAKDLIIRGGHNIDPLVIEEPAHQHPAVEMAAAVGRPDAYAGEVPVLYVQLRPDATASPEELQTFVRERIGERAANPAAVHLVPEMPLTGVGKIFKPALRWDAVRMVFQSLVDPIAAEAGLTATVEAGAHDTRGTLATVTFAGAAGDRGTVEARIAEALAPFTVHHEVRWA